MKLYLIRHGQTTANLAMVFSGQHDFMLTDLGREQAKSIRPILEKIPFDRVYSSDLTRAVETQQLALPNARDVIRTSAVREVDVGHIAGLPYQEVAERYGTSYRRNRDYAAFGGENPQMMDARIQGFLDEIKDLDCERIAVFAHNGVLSSVLRLVVEAEINRSAVTSDNCAIHIFEYKNGKWRLLAWNYMKEIL